MLTARKCARLTVAFWLSFPIAVRGHTTVLSVRGGRCPVVGAGSVDVSRECFAFDRIHPTSAGCCRMTSDCEKSSHPLKLLKSTCPSRGQSSEAIIFVRHANLTFENKNVVTLDAGSWALKASRLRARLLPQTRRRCADRLRCARALPQMHQSTRAPNASMYVDPCAAFAGVIPR